MRYTVIEANKTRMVQLPATAAIEYVAACCTKRTRTRTRTKTKIGTITKTVRGPYARSPQVQYVYAPSGLSVPSIVAWRTKKTDKFGPLAPRGVDPPPQIFRVCRGGCTLHISSKHYVGPTPFYGARAGKPPKKADFAMKQTNVCHRSGDIKNRQTKKTNSAP